MSDTAVVGPTTVSAVLAGPCERLDPAVLTPGPLRILPNVWRVSAFKMSERQAASGKFVRCPGFGTWPGPLLEQRLQAANVVVQSLIWLVIRDCCVTRRAPGCPT
jgi:hypothetical protein